MNISFNDILPENNLYNDFLYDFGKVDKFYSNDFRDVNGYKSIFQKLSEKKNDNLEIIKDNLLKLYSKYQPSEKTIENIKKLPSKNTIAVFTGQQLGLLGGPLYTIYKVFTAIKLSEELNEQFSDFNFVPVFWMAGDDHDFEEISFINLINKENNLVKIIYDDGNPINFNRGAVGNIILNENINIFKEEIKTNLRETDYTPSFLDFIENILTDTISLRQSFFNFLYQIFDDTGLIIFDPQEQYVKNLLKPIFKKELENYKTHTAALLSNSIDLDEQYHAQVKIKPINLFMEDNSGRHLIEPIENEYRLKGKRKRISKEEIFDTLEKNPEKFSANVLLRPICEDYLFRTGFYIGGPGEISYYAQTGPLYNNFDIPQPIVFPRASATVLESNIAKIIVKNNLTTKDFFRGDNYVKALVLDNIGDLDLNGKFDNVKSLISTQLDNLGIELSQIDKNIVNNVESVKNKVLHQLDVLLNKSNNAYERKHEVSLRQISKVCNVVHPNNNFQERELCILNFINKYGFDFIDWLYNELDIRAYQHQILEI